MVKKNAKAPIKPKTVVRSFQKSNQKASEDPNKRFRTLPRSLNSFVKYLDPQHVYIISLDREERGVKFHAFFASACINVAIVAFAAYRLYLGIFTYPALISALWSDNSPARDLPYDATVLTSMPMILLRSTGMMIDYILINFLLPLPVQFFFEGPVRWRWSIGLLPTEIVVRKDRGWAKKLDNDKWYKELNNSTMNDIIIPATAAEHLGKTGYWLIDTNWNLDFNAMIQAHKYVSDHKASFDDYRTAVLVNPLGPSVAIDKASSKKKQGKPAREHSEDNESKSVESSNSSNSSSGVEGWLLWRIDPFDEEEEEKELSQRDKIEQIRQKLLKLDKEDVFYRWIELLQYEMSSPGEWDREKQLRCDEQVQELFQKNGLDFNQFYEEIGGMEGVIA